MRVFKIGRDARTGQFIAVRNAQERPSTTTVETMKIPTRRPVRRRTRAGSPGSRAKAR
jgi:hypothetical protein